MTILFQQTFQTTTPSKDVRISSTSISSNASTQTLTGPAGTFTSLSASDWVHIYGFGDSYDSTYIVASKSVDHSQIVCTATNTKTLPSQASGSTIVVRTGASESFLDTFFWAAGTDYNNTGMARIGYDAFNGYYLESWSPKFKKNNDQSGWKMLCPLSSLTGLNTGDFWCAWWQKFLPGTASGTLDADITANATSLSFTLDTGSIDDFPATKDLPYSTNDANSLFNNKPYAMEVVLGDVASTSFESIGYATRTGAGPYGLTSLSRAIHGTTARAWPAGTRVTIGYEWAKGHKMPGINAGSQADLRGGIAYANARPGYQGFDFNITPRGLGTYELYTYYGDTANPPTQHNQTHRFHGDVSGWAPPGYAGTKQLIKLNRWQCVEMHLKMNSSPGVADGEVHVWLDGTKVIQKTDIPWRSIGALFSTWNNFSFSTHWGTTNDQASQKEERHLVTKLTFADAQINLFDDGEPGNSTGGSSSQTNLQLESGSYTGNGTSQSIPLTDGRTPVLVIIKCASTQYPVFATNLMTDTAYFSGAFANITSGAIASLGAGSFSVGSHATVNSSLTTYYYVAFYADSSGNFGVFQYSGDGFDDKTVTGFANAPKWAYVKGDGAYAACSKSQYETTDSVDWSTAVTTVTDGIKTLDTAGITLGINNIVNHASTTYNGFWFKTLNGYIMTGHYTGDGTDDRTIDISTTADETATDFQPDFVLTQNLSGSDYCAGRWGVAAATDTSFRLHNLGAAANYIQSTSSNGFVVGNTSTVNQASRGFVYLAVKNNPNAYSVASAAPAGYICTVLGGAVSATRGSKPKRPATYTFLVKSGAITVGRTGWNPIADESNTWTEI